MIFQKIQNNEQAAGTAAPFICTGRETKVLPGKKVYATQTDAAMMRL